MVALLRRLTLGLVLVGSLLWFGGGQSAPAAAQACDPSYPYVCLPAGQAYDCFAIGFPILVIHDPVNGATDPYNLDPDFNGIGCEGF
jgi:hypothetical protein